MSNQFPIIIVPTDANPDPETLGTKYKFWFLHPELGYCLYKQARSNTGEDWAEKISSELCQLLGLPHARIELATFQDNRGTVSPSFVPSNGTLILGNDILYLRDPDYPKAEKFKVSQHTLDVVLKAIANPLVNLPLDWTPQISIQTALETFVGYLLLDAWIGNTDRHHENWGFILISNSRLMPSLTMHLAPTFDHASSLGRELQDIKRQAQQQYVNKYVAKCRSAIYARVGDNKAMFTIDVFRTVARLYPHAALLWLDRLSMISKEETRSLFDQIPKERISEIAIEFAQNILEINQHKLLELREENS